MIIGLLLGVSVAVFFASTIIIFAGLSGALQDNLVTGAVIGTSGAMSYAIMALILSFISIFFIIIILRKKIIVKTYNPSLRS